MQGMDFKPLEITDFSGGTTENVLQADPRRSATIDNFFITVDKKLEERYAFVPIDSLKYITPAGHQPINGIYSFISETELMTQSNRSLFAVDPDTDNWVPILGPNGAEPIQGGDSNSQTTYAEFQRQIYFTNDGVDGQGILPSKIYRDETDTWVARTAGLPRSYVAGNYTQATLLAKCISLANNLRSAMVAHFGSAKNTAFYVIPYTTNPASDPYYDDINIHVNIDKYSLSYLVAQTFAGYPETPNPIPTPAPSATDEATLYTLIAALGNAYSHHVEDSMKGSLGQYIPNNTVGALNYPYYHFNTLYGYNGIVSAPWFAYNNEKIARGPGPILSLRGAPDDLETAAQALDELLQKWNWHRKAVNTHSPKNSPAQYDVLAPTESKVGRVNLDNTYPTITPDYTDLYNYANNMKYIYNIHLGYPNNSSPVNPHTQADNYLFGMGQRCNLDDVSNIDDFYLMVYWLRCLYTGHVQDSFVGSNSLPLSFTTTANSATITGTWASLSETFYPFLAANSNVFKPVAGGSSWNGTSSYVAKVISSGANTAVLDRQAISSGSQTNGLQTQSRYHVARGAQGVPVAIAVDSTQLLGNSPITVGVDIANWNDLLTELYQALVNHANTASSTTLKTHNWSETYSIAQVNAPNPFYIPDIAQYVYAFYFSDGYTVEPNGIEYLTQGNPIFSDVYEEVVSYPLNYSIPPKFTSYQPITVTRQAITTISNLPLLTNDSNTNYDTNDIILNIYRTLDSGTTYYQLAEVPNGTTTYIDNVNDTLSNPNETSLDEREVLYTSGGVVGSDQPPQSKYIHILDGVVYYGGVWDGNQFFPNRIRQSVQYAPDWAPATFYDDLDDEITGISSTKSNVIAFCKNSIYRMSGVFNSLGQGALLHQKIADSLGGINAKSIVKTEIGVFFAGNDGFYYTDGFQIIKISLEHDKAYLKLTKSKAQKDNIYGAYDKSTRRVFWTMREDETDTCNNVAFVFYLDYGTKPSGVFTHIRNGSYYRPSSQVFQNGTYYYGHEQGFVMKSDPYNKSDAKVDVRIPMADWGTTFIPFNWTSTAIDMGSTYKRKYITKAHITGKNEGNVSSEIYVIRDLDEGKQKAMAPITYVDNVVWGVPIYIWGDELCKWEYDWTMDLWRRFPHSLLRSDFIQLKYVPNYGNVYASSVNYPEFSDAIIDPFSKSIIISTPTGYSNIVWPDDVVGYNIAFEFDNYETEYEINFLDPVDKFLIIVDDPDDTLIEAESKWVIKGYKKNQRATLNSVILHFAFLGDETQSYPGANSNSGPGNAGGNP